MSFFKRIGDFASTAYDATKSFFSSPKFDTARTIAEGAGNVVSSMREALGRSGIQDFKPEFDENTLMVKKNKKRSKVNSSKVNGAF